MCFSFYRVDLINSDYRVYIAMYYFLYWYTEITDTQHYTVMKLHYKYLFIFHIIILYNLDQLMYLFVVKSLVSYATMHT